MNDRNLQRSPLINSTEILKWLEEPTEDRRPLKRKLQREALVKDLIKALQQSKTELTKCILCDILAERHAKTALPVLIDCLSDPSEDVRDNAAEALGKIGSPKAGAALLRHFIDEKRTWFAIALGAVGNQEAIPHLIDALSSPSEMVRGGAAWSLGALHASSARRDLERSLANEKDSYAYERMKEALEIISNGDVNQE
jgi:HEAT repeat protein